MRLTKVLLFLFAAASQGAVGGETAATMETKVKITRVELVAQPMVFVTATVSMAEIPTFMGTAFATLGQFLGDTKVTALGPPLAIYHDWSGDMTAVDVSFPVSAADATKAAGAVRAGSTPDGHALKAIHKGSYDNLPATYAAISAAMADAGIPDSARMWEVYIGEPGVTPDADLITEIYTSVSAEDAAKFPAE